jgi:hypothetical protein
VKARASRRIADVRAELFSINLSITRFFSHFLFPIAIMPLCEQGERQVPGVCRNEKNNYIGVLLSAVTGWRRHGGWSKRVVPLEYAFTS